MDNIVHTNKVNSARCCFGHHWFALYEGEKNTWSDLLLWMINWYRIKMFDFIIIKQFDFIIIKQFVIARSSSETFFLFIYIQHFFLLLLTIWDKLKMFNQFTIQPIPWNKTRPNILFRHISNVKWIALYKRK